MEKVEALLDEKSVGRIQEENLGKRRSLTWVIPLKTISATIVLLLLLAFSSTTLAYDDALPDIQEPEYFRGKVMRITETESTDSFFDMLSQRVEIRILSGPYKGQTIGVNHAVMGDPVYDIEVKVGDEVLLWVITDEGGIREAHIDSMARDRSMLWLLSGYLVLLVVVGRRKGVQTVLTLAITVLAIFKVLLPLILKGYSPILMATLVSSGIAAVTLATVGGINKKALAAVIGTTGGVVVAGLAALWAGLAARLTGFVGHETAMLLYIPQEIDLDFRGLLFAGILIGALGAVMDVAMSISSSMEEVRRLNPSIKPRDLFKSGMNVGRDVMGTMSNTLILAYTGGALPLLLVLLAYETPLVRVVNLDLMATEIIRALTGSVGLVMAIPITALVASYLLGSHD